MAFSGNSQFSHKGSLGFRFIERLGNLEKILGCFSERLGNGFLWDQAFYYLENFGIMWRASKKNYIQPQSLHREDTYPHFYIQSDVTKVHVCHKATN